MSSLFRNRWANPWVRRPLLLGLALAVVFGGCWLAIDQLGKRAWRDLERQLAAEGETTDFRALLSPPVPEAENFCAIGPLRNLGAGENDASAAGLEGRTNRKRIEGLMKARPAKQSMHGLSKGTPLDFAAMAEGMRKEGGWPMPAEAGDAVRDVHAGLAKWDPLIAELAAGLGRPRAQWTPALSTRELKRPYVSLQLAPLSPVLQLGQSLTLRAAVAARAGDMPRAIEALRIVDRIATASYDEPLLLPALVAGTVEALTAHALWELAWTQQGTAEEWAQLEQVITARDRRATMLRSYRGELAADLDTVRFAGETRQTAQLMMLLPGLHFPTEPDGPLEEAAVMGLTLAPPGFFDSLATELGSDQLTYTVRPLRAEGWPAFLRKQHELTARSNGPQPLWNLPARMMREQTVLRSMARGIYLQVQADQAAIACVLERARLAGGSYPASLEGLTLADGRALPPDACTGEPMHYRQTQGGRYVLWSVGPDGRDEGGRRGSDLAGLGSAEYTGDWVWGYSAAP